MIITVENLEQLVVVLKHFNITSNIPQLELAFPHPLHLDTVHEESMPEEEVTFQEFNEKYL